MYTYHDLVGRHGIVSWNNGGDGRKVRNSRRRDDEGERGNSPDNIAL